MNGDDITIKLNNIINNRIYGEFELHWTPIDKDYDRIFNEAIIKKYNWK